VVWLDGSAEEGDALAMTTRGMGGAAGIAARLDGSAAGIATRSDGGEQGMSFIPKPR
jgi:hypothetical protein